MARPMIILVSDNREDYEKVKSYGTAMGYQVSTFSSTEWSRGLQDPNFRGQLGGDVPSLVAGSGSMDAGAKILQFPSNTMPTATTDKKVRTINELESIAIENAIHEFGGNLTEAAKALGIGRATLYRKVKQYSIDPANARRKKAA